MKKVNVGIYHADGNLITKGHLNIGNYRNVISYLREEASKKRLLPITQSLDKVSFVSISNISFIGIEHKLPKTFNTLISDPSYVEITVHTAGGRVITGLFKKEIEERTSDSLNKIQDFFILLSKNIYKKDLATINLINMDNVTSITPMKNAGTNLYPTWAFPGGFFNYISTKSYDNFWLS